MKVPSSWGINSWHATVLENHILSWKLAAMFKECASFFFYAPAACMIGSAVWNSMLTCLFKRSVWSENCFTIFIFDIYIYYIQHCYWLSTYNQQQKTTNVCVCYFPFLSPIWSFSAAQTGNSLPFTLSQSFSFRLHNLSWSSLIQRVFWSVMAPFHNFNILFQQCVFLCFIIWMNRYT